MFSAFALGLKTTIVILFTKSGQGVRKTLLGMCFSRFFSLPFSVLLTFLGARPKNGGTKINLVLLCVRIFPYNDILFSLFLKFDDFLQI